MTPTVNFLDATCESLLAATLAIPTDSPVKAEVLKVYVRVVVVDDDDDDDDDDEHLMMLMMNIIVKRTSAKDIWFCKCYRYLSFL